VIPYWDLRPGEEVRLRPAADPKGLVTMTYTGGDTRDAVFQLEPGGARVYFRKDADGSLWRGLRRWVVAGEPRHTRVLIDSKAGRI
jgi:hypothetical protein